MWHNPGILALASGLLAQAVKVLVELVVHGRMRPGLFFTNGGMPSSHAATVTTLSFLVARSEGLDSVMFSLVLIFSLFVIFEATGLRQEMGKQAQLLNELLDGGGLGWEVLHGKRLRELMGHTWTEVLGGIVCGILAALWWAPGS